MSGILDNTRLFQQAQEAICVRDEFVSLAAHELRTPLTALRTSAAGILRQAEKGDGAAAESVLRLGKIVARQVEHLDRLNERILAASQIVGHLTLRTERFDLAASVGEVARGLAVRAAQSGSCIRVEAEAPVIGVWDRGRIEQAVGNLLENAIKFGAGQRIEVSVGARDGTRSSPCGTAASASRPSSSGRSSSATSAACPRRTSAVSDSASTSCASSSRPTAAPCAPRAGRGGSDVHRAAAGRRGGGGRARRDFAMNVRR